MGMYEVVIGVDVPNYGTVTVEAESQEAAEDKVEQDIFSYEENIEEWQEEFGGAENYRVVRRT